jgi:hypothetical protein
MEPVLEQGEHVSDLSAWQHGASKEEGHVRRSRGEVAIRRPVPLDHANIVA